VNEEAIARAGLQRERERKEFRLSANRVMGEYLDVGEGGEG
jgi:hypothetical protein